MIPYIKPGSPLGKAKEYLSTVALTQEMMDFGKYNEQSSPWGMIRGWYYDGEASRLFTKLDNTILAQSLHCFIGFDESAVENEAALPPGISKIKGLPQLPASIAWPADMLFLAQFNLADVRPHDVQQMLPGAGMLYFFFSPNTCDGKVIYYEGPLDQLSLCVSPPDFPDRRHYLKKFEQCCYQVNFRKQATIAIDGLVPALPGSMKTALESILDCPLVKHRPGEHLFGQPAYWQGEGELFDDEQRDDEADLMLFQYDFAEGHVHFWISREELEVGDFSKVYLDYSGT